jgi:hypothetical protein
MWWDYTMCLSFTKQLRIIRRDWIYLTFFCPKIVWVGSINHFWSFSWDPFHVTISIDSVEAVNLFLLWQFSKKCNPVHGVVHNEIAMRLGMEMSFVVHPWRTCIRAVAREAQTSREHGVFFPCRFWPRIGILRKSRQPLLSLAHSAQSPEIWLRASWWSA